MNELEKVEKLREKADVSFADAKEALDNANGDILDALIYLENQGKAIVPAGGGFFSGATTPEKEQKATPQEKSNPRQKGESFSESMRRFGRFLLMLLRKGNSNYLDATRDDKELFTVPVTAVVLLLFISFGLAIPLFIISLFCGVRYHFRGEELGRDSVNQVLKDASGVVDGVKHSLKTKEDNKDSEDNAESEED